MVTTFSILADMVKQVGGNSVHGQAFVGPDGDVHVYEPRPEGSADAAVGAVAGAKRVGAGRLDRSADRGERVQRQGGRRVGGGDPADDAGGGRGATTDPHAWQDARNALLYVRAISAGLASADPAHTAQYRDAAARYGEQIAQTDAWIVAELGANPGERTADHHDARCVRLLRRALRGGVPVGRGYQHRIRTFGQGDRRAGPTDRAGEGAGGVHREHDQSADGADAGHETGAVLGGTVYSDALSPPDGPAATYLQMMRHNTTLFVAAMGT